MSATNPRRELLKGTLADVERLLALAELLYERTDALTTDVAGLSEEDDDPMGRTAECVHFAHCQAEDVVGGLRRASARLRDDMGLGGRGF